MLDGKTDDAWEYYGRTDPYYGVITWEPFRSDNLTADGRKSFFESGEHYIDQLLAAVDRDFEPGFRPTRVLDFGCGVGRLVIPLAKRADSVVGVDVSVSMLETALRNANERGLSNVEFVQSDDSLSRVTGTFDLVHSLITFQHIPPIRGLGIFERLVEVLRPNGIGALHVTYGFATPLPRYRRVLAEAQYRFRLGNALYNVVKRQPVSKPPMQMNAYDVNGVLRILQRAGCHHVHLRFTETMVRRQPFYGVTLLFRKIALDTREHA